MMETKINLQKYKLFKSISETFLQDLTSLLNKIMLFEPEDLNQEYDKYALELRERISSMYITTPFVLKSKVEDEFFIQDGIKYLLKHLKVDQLVNKPVSIGEKADYTKESSLDPFAPPFQEGQVLEDDFGGFNTHRIFFSKFAIMEEHLLLVTRDFRSQYTHLTFEDIKNSILLIKVMEGVVFFNGGKNSGASQIRKHLQCIPYKSMHDKDFGIFLLIEDKANLQQVNLFNIENFQLPNVDFHKIKKFTEVGINHLLIKFSEEFQSKLTTTLNEDTIEIYSEILFNLYNIGLINLDLNEDVQKLTKHYSVLLTREWILILPRKTHEVWLKNGNLNINSIGFLLTMMVKNQNLAGEIKLSNILSDIYAKLC